MKKEATNPNIDCISLRRELDTHKGSYGKILIAAGSLGMCGAAILAAKGAYRSGAGVVYVTIPKELFPTIHCGVCEAVLVHREIPLPKLNDYQAIAIGPGIGQGEDTKGFLNYVISTYKGPLVLDADALNVLADAHDYSLLKEYQGPLILTPHPGEAQRLLHMSLEEYKSFPRQEIAFNLVKLTGAIVVLKGWDTLIANQEGIIKTNTTGNPGMATGGTGDVLTGIITALLGRGVTPFDAATFGAYVHGLAGDIAAEDLGMTSMIAGDLIEYLPKAFMEIERRS